MNHMIKFLTKQFKTACPYQIAKKNNVIVIPESLGNISGYYNKVNEQKFIHVNSDLSEWVQTFIVAYQLYYALQDIEYQFLTFNKSDHESDAFKFAIALLCYDHEIPRHDLKAIMA